MAMMDIKYPLAGIVEKVGAELERQQEKWGEQNHPTKPENLNFSGNAVAAKDICDKFEGTSEQTWFYILQEEFFEVFAEDNLEKQNDELIQVIAVATRMIECNNRRIEKM